MHPFQESIQSWLSRRLYPKAHNQCLDIPFVLSTDIGLEREENQDRAVAIYTGKRSINPLFALVVADGMGGMRDGGLCSSLATSSFLYSLIQHRHLEIKDRAYIAIKESNKQVHDIYKGHGGSTLTAILFDSYGQKIIIHVGDTRVYTFNYKKNVHRHTTDDSLMEAVGGSGRELLQFIGMGEPMLPKISDFPISDAFCAITTDGIHGVEQDTLNRILTNSFDILETSKRLNSLSSWCGGHDNATSAIFNIPELLISLERYDGSGIRIWDAGGDLTTLWLREEDQAIQVKIEKNQFIEQDQSSYYSTHKENKNIVDQNRKKAKSAPRKTRRKKANSSPDEIQLNIEIDNPLDQGNIDADSK